jgi:hypothetical protein
MVTSKHRVRKEINIKENLLETRSEYIEWLHMA